MAKQLEMLDSISNDIRASSVLSDANKAELELKLQEAKREAYKGDRWFYRAVLIILASVAFTIIVAVVILTLFNKNGLQAVLVPLAATCIGAIGGVLVPSPSSS